MSEIKTDKLTGVATADVVSLTTGATTTTLQKAVLTSFFHYDARAQSLEASMNQSSLTDNSSGDFTSSFSTNFSSSTDKFVLAQVHNSVNGSEGAANNRGGAVCSQNASAQSTSSLRVDYYYGSRSDSSADHYDYDSHYGGQMGDLA